MAFVITWCEAGKHVYAYDNSKPKPESCPKHKNANNVRIKPLKGGKNHQIR